MKTQTTIECPNCHTQIDVNEILYHQMEEEFKQKTLLQQKQLQEEVEQKRLEYKQAFESLKQQQKSFDQQLQEATKKLLEEQKQELQKQIKAQLIVEQNESMELLKKELQEKSLQVQELNKAKVEVEKLKREKEEIASTIEAKAEIALTKKLQEEKEVLQKRLQEQNELKFRQKEEQLKQLQEQLQIAQRKAEQGSMQLQGEVQELAIEEYLKEQYPFDTIQEIKKGARGADCIEIVHTRELQNCGKIYYESKRTKEFQKAWIEKFKADMREKGVDVGVLVTQVLPTGMQRMGLVDGVWVCTFEEFKGLSAVLRESVIRLALVEKTQENKSDKMSLLYNYLTSTEFSMQIEAIVEGFSMMQSDLDKEKRAMAKIWKQRDKQIQKVLENTIGMYGSIKGIAGNAVADVDALELGFDDE